MSLIRPHIESMTGYSYGEQPDDPKVIKLNTNENPYPPSGAVELAFSSFHYANLKRYPDATGKKLREAIAKRHKLKPEQVLLTNGGDEGIRLLAMACLSEQSLMVAAEPSYSLYPVVAAMQNARFEPLPLSENFQLPETAGDICFDAEADLVCIPNPHAPSGVLYPKYEIEYLLKEFFTGVVLIDEAYVDFVEPSLKHNLVPLIKKYDNLVILRTFSKGYSLAGLRLGYLLGDADLIGELGEKVRDSYNVSTLAQTLGLAAFEDVIFSETVWRLIRSERGRLLALLSHFGFYVSHSEANFVLAEHEDKANLKKLFQELRDRQILVRYFDTPRLRHALRITVGTEEENTAFLDALMEILDIPPTLNQQRINYVSRFTRH